MSLPKKLASGLRNVFSYVRHQESADDVKRKGETVDKLLGGAEAAPHLREALLEVRTKHLDTLIKKNVKVELDKLPVQALSADTPDITVEGRYRPAQDGGGKLTISDTSSPENMATAVEKIARLLRRETPTTDMYALRSTVTAAGGEGAVSSVSVVEWHAAPARPAPQAKAAKPG